MATPELEAPVCKHAGYQKRALSGDALVGYPKALHGKNDKNITPIAYEIPHSRVGGTCAPVSSSRYLQQMVP